MAETTPQQGQGQVQLRIDETKMSTSYANTIRTSTTGDEIILDFGYNVPMQMPGQAPMIVFNVGSRVIMNWTAAKRLAMSLGGAIRQFEAQNGEIPINQNAAAAGAAAGAAAAGQPDPDAG